MRSVLRYIAALLAMASLFTGAAAGLVCCVTTGTFAREMNGTASLLTQQQARIDQAAANLTQAWNLTPDILAVCTQEAAVRQSQAAADWWHALWHDPDADHDMPAWLDATQERELVAVLLQDGGFRAVTDDGQRRAIARDDIAYALDEAVCDAVTPLRRSIVSMGADMLAERISLPRVRQAVLIGAMVLATSGLLLLFAAHRLAGSILVTTAGLMAGAAGLIWMMDIPGMLEQLNLLAAEQGRNALACMAILWLGMAALMLALGVIVICVKKAQGEDEA